jgi:hypothetical protein
MGNQSTVDSEGWFAIAHRCLNRTLQGKGTSYIGGEGNDLTDTVANRVAKGETEEKTVLVSVHTTHAQQREWVQLW